MNNIQELKELKIDYPTDAEIKGYKTFYNRVIKRASGLLILTQSYKHTKFDKEVDLAETW